MITLSCLLNFFGHYSFLFYCDFFVYHGAKCGHYLYNYKLQSAVRQVPSLVWCKSQVGTLLISARTQNGKFTKMSAPFLPCCLVRCCMYESHLSKCHFLGKNLGCRQYFQCLSSVGKIVKIHCLQHRYSEFCSLKDPEKKYFHVSYADSEAFSVYNLR
jgi:hypothetical protein